MILTIEELAASRKEMLATAQRGMEQDTRYLDLPIVPYPHPQDFLLRALAIERDRWWVFWSKDQQRLKRKTESTA